MFIITIYLIQLHSLKNEQIYGAMLLYLGYNVTQFTGKSLIFFIDFYIILKLTENWITKLIQ